MRVYTKSVALVTASYRYDAPDRLMTVDRDGTLVDQRLYDTVSRVVQSGPTSLATGYADKLNEGLAANQQIGMEVRRQTYDANGRLTFQRVKHRSFNRPQQQRPSEPSGPRCGGMKSR